MFKKATIALVSALLLLPTLASAKDMTGKFGLGYFLSDAPVGIRYWVTPKVGLDVGVGFAWADPGGTAESTTDITFEVGVPYVLLGTERANLFLRPGVLFGLPDDSSGYDSQITITLGPGAEVFFGDNFSLEASHGIAYSIWSPSVGDSQSAFTTFGEGVSSLGFHFYF